MNLAGNTQMSNKRVTLADGRLLQVGALVYRLHSQLHISGEQGRGDRQEARESPCEVLLVTSRGRGRWIIPKGWPMKRRTLAQSALQEAYEEAGIRGFIDENSLGSYHYKKNDMAVGENNRFHVVVFALLYQSQKEKWPEKSQRIFEWVTPLEAAERVEETRLKKILKNFTPPPLSSQYLTERDID